MSKILWHFWENKPTTTLMVMVVGRCSDSFRCFFFFATRNYQPADRSMRFVRVSRTSHHKNDVKPLLEQHGIESSDGTSAAFPSCFHVENCRTTDFVTGGTKKRRNSAFCCHFRTFLRDRGSYLRFSKHVSNTNAHEFDRLHKISFPQSCFVSLHTTYPPTSITSSSFQWTVHEKTC